MRLLREKGSATKFLILVEIASGHHSRLSSIARKLDITNQAVSEYLKKMKKEGLVQQIEGEYRATKKGIQFLHSNFLELKRFADSKMEGLDIIDVCAAIAKTDIKKGERVALFMEDGSLIARANEKSSSTGIAMRDAVTGEDVPLKDLYGIIEHSMGKLYLVELPSVREGGSRAVKMDKIEEILMKTNPDKIGIGDIVAKSIMKKLGMKYDFEFAPIESSIEAAQRGLSVIFLGSGDKIGRAISIIQDFNSSSMDKIGYEMIDIDKIKSRN